MHRVHSSRSPYAAMIVGCVATLNFVGMRAGGNEHGPSLLFYAATALGSLQLLALVIELGTQYTVVAASCLALRAMVVSRNFFTVREAVTADKARRKTEVEASQKREAQFDADYQAQWQAIEAEWKSTIGPVYRDLESASTKAGELFPPWEPPLLQSSPARSRHWQMRRAARLR